MQTQAPPPHPEATAADRKVVLMRILAMAEARRQGLCPSVQQVQQTTQWWRKRFNLERPERFAAWLRYAGMDIDCFLALMTEFATLVNVQEHYAGPIEDALGAHLAIHSVYDFEPAQVRP